MDIHQGRNSNFVDRRNLYRPDDHSVKLLSRRSINNFTIDNLLRFPESSSTTWKQMDFLAKLWSIYRGD